LERYRIVTSNSDLYSELGFNDQQSSRLLLYNRNDEVIVDIEQGAIDQQRGVYARLADDENVYLISDEIVFQLEQRAGYWQQGNLFPAGLVSQNVIAFSLIASGIPLGNDGEEIRADYTLIRTAPTGNEFPAWQVNESPEIAVDQAEIDTLLSSLLILEADSFSALSASEVGINDASDARIEITLDDESRYTIAIIDNPLEAALYYLTIKGPRAATRADGSDYLYNVNEFSIRPLIKALPDLFPPPQEDETEGETASP